MPITAAQALARVLKAEGVEWVSTFPVCSVNNTLAEEGIPLIMMRDERYAVAVADAFSRITGGKRIGVCTVMGGTNAAGVQIAYGAVAQAFEDGSPVLCITDAVPPAARSQTDYDIAAGLRSITKWIGEISQPHTVVEVMRRAFTYLRTGRPGPVLVTIPRSSEQFDEGSHPYTPVKGWRAGPDPDDVKAAVNALLTARNPLLYVGEGVFYADATVELLQFAELAQIPVLTTLKAKSAFPENHPLALGVRGDPAVSFLTDCDVLLAIGTSMVPGHFAHGIPSANHKTIIQCCVDERDINRSYQVRHALLGDAKLTLRALIEELSRAGGAPRRQGQIEAIAAARERFMASYRPLLTSDEKPINPYRVYGDLMKVLDRHNSCVSPDSGTPRDQTSTIYEALIPRGFLGWGNISTLGFSLAAAMAAKLAYPERQCVAITGDGGVGYMLGNLEALVRYKIGVTIIHINNGGFAGYGPGFWGKGHDPYTFVVSDHDAADMSQAAAAIGCYAEHIFEPAEIIPALRRGLEQNAHGQPAYLEFICSQYPVFGQWARAT